MLGIKVEKSDNNLVIKWKLSRIEIPISEIIDVTLDDTYAGKEKTAIRIGTPYATTDRLVIKTNNDTYILFTTNVTSIRNKINLFINS